MTALNIELGDKLKDNDPRVTYNRVLTVERLTLDAFGKLEKIHAREWPGSQLVRISAARVHAAAPPRRSGFTLEKKKPMPPELLRLLGKEIALRRGSVSRLEGYPGCERTVRARLDQVEGIVVHATLLEDDALATVEPFKAGEPGIWHGLSFIDGFDATAA